MCGSCFGNFEPGLGAIDQRQHRDGRGGLALGFLDARKFAVNFRAHRFVLRGQFLSAAGAHGVQNVVGVDGLQRTRGRVGGFGAGDFSDEPRGEERLQNLLREPGGNAQFGGNFLDGDRRQAALEALSDARHQPQRDEFASALVDVFRQFVLQIRRAVLEGVGDLGAEEQNQPGKIKPDHEHGHEAEAAVNFAVGDDAGNVEKTEEVVQMPQRPAHDAADERRAETDPGVRHEQINQRERQPQNHERQELENQVADERHLGDEISGGLQMRAAGQPQRRDNGERTQRDGRPIKHDAKQPVASARHAPDVVERVLDVREHLNGHIDQQQHADHAERAAAGVLDEFMNVLGRLLLRGGHPRVGATGHRPRRPRQHWFLRRHWSASMRPTCPG